MNEEGWMNRDLPQTIKDIREQTVRCIASLGVGHLGGSLSLAEILGSLYFVHMRVDPQNPGMPGRDRLIVSKGHAGPGVYATLALKGYFPLEDLLTLNVGGTRLPSHCDMNMTPGIDMTTGSLGQGFSCAVGVAMASRLLKDGATIYTIIGDGESQEGQVWEAAMYAGNQRLNHLIAFTDYNDLQIDGPVSQVNDLNPLADKWRAFGWFVQEIDGHDTVQIDAAINAAKAQDKAAMIIARTVKGKGVAFVEAMGAGNHNMPLSPEQADKAIAQIRGEA